MASRQVGPRRRADGAVRVMRVSVVTPSFNQAQFLPKNLESVRDQTYPSVEHIVVDPGSTDGSRELAAGAAHVSLIAEPDSGQSEGICTGFERAEGDVLTWLNSDDFYPNEHVIGRVVALFETDPDADVVYGDVDFVGTDHEFLRKGFVNPEAEGLLRSFEYQVGIVQPGVFIRRRVFEALGGPSESFEYCMDYEYWVRIAANGFRWSYAGETLANHRWWSGMKTSRGRDKSLLEHFRVCHQYFGYIHWKWLDRYAEFLTTAADGIVHHAEAVDEQAKRLRTREVIARFVTQDALRSLSRADDPERRATLAFITEQMSPERYAFAAAELSIREEHSDDPQADAHKGWNVFVARESDGTEHAAYHVPGNFDRYVRADWLEMALARGQDTLAAVAAKRADVCVIVGNGPSLNDTDLGLLGGADVIVSNFALLNGQLAKHATLLTVVNDLVARQGAVELNAARVTKVVPFWLANCINPTDETAFVSATLRPRFNGELAGEFSWRSTVSFLNMQLAYALGYRRALLIGFDHSYVQPDDVSEGDEIRQLGHDVNHFDSRYFQGRTWQAADTTQMDVVYSLARDAFERDGREIINCTVGGRLEVFRRGVLEHEIDESSDLSGSFASSPLPDRASPREQGTNGGARAVGRGRSHVRALIIDSTRVGALNATGQMKRNLLGDWPDDAFLQLWMPGSNQMALAIKVDDHTADVRVSSEAQVRDAVRDFDPEVIYYRPTIDTHPRLHEIACEIFEAQSAPLVTHIVDDWPSRLTGRDPAGGAAADAALREVFGRSRRTLSISEKMSSTFQTRYGSNFEPISNGVDVDRWRNARRAARPVKAAREGVLLRYCGALASDMTFDTIVSVARAVDALQDDLPLQFEVYTMATWRKPFEQAVKGLRGTSVHESVPGEQYPVLLATSDVLLLGYNFDPHSLRYIGLSMPNKLPEYLASGAAVLAVGPAEANGIEYVATHELGACVTQPGREPLVAALRALVEDSTHRDVLARRGLRWVSEHLDLMTLSRRFQAILREAAAEAQPAPLAGPFPRSHGAAVVEGSAIASLIQPADRPGVMLDVGAHHGSSLASFSRAGWRVIACEPDAENRAALIKRHGSAPNVAIDPRAVSAKSAKDAPFFSSDESTGISALHAFRETHREVAKVEVTTVAELVDEHSLERIDYLKIDVEGFDFDVLQGVPWERVAPDVIECEFEDAKTVPRGHTWRDVCNYLTERGYTVYLSEWHPIVRYGIRHQWRQLVRYPTPLASDDGWGNILAFRGDPGDEAVRAAFLEALEVQDPPDSGGIHTASVPPETAVPAAPTAPAGDPVSSDSVSRYDGLYLRLRDHNPLLFAAGRLVMWCTRKARRYPAPVGVYLAILAALTVGGFLPLFEPQGSALWAAAGLLVLLGILLVAVGFSRFLIKEAQHDLALKHLALRRRVERTEASAAAEPHARESLEKELEAHRADLTRLRSEIDAREAEIAANQRALEEAIDGRLAQLASEQETARDALASEIDAEKESARKSQAAMESRLSQLASEHETAQGALASEIEAVKKSGEESKADVERRLDAMRSDLSEAADRGLSIDIVSALRQVNPLWQGENGDREIGWAGKGEHGHAMLMELLVDEARRNSGCLRGKTLIEIGSTREKDPPQGSTEKLAVFTALTNMRFISVDVDPQNTARANQVIAHLNPAASAVTARGESYLSSCPESLDYVYLDAFDFEHGEHSDQRRERYRELLNTEINDEACWEMHQLCAAALVTRMPEGGIVVIDDTWTDDKDQYAGKGRLAVPLLVAGGFTVITQAPRAIALKRTATSPAAAKRTTGSSAADTRPAVAR